MTQIAIPDEIASTLASAAMSRGCSEGDLAAIFIQLGLRNEYFDLTPAEESRLLKSIQRSEQGEVVEGEVVMARFDSVLRQIESR